MVFFFQAEDGIRYLVRSRGLGDVYKRQAMYRNAGEIKNTKMGILQGKQKVSPDSLANLVYDCLLYTSDAADERSSVDLGGRRIIKNKYKIHQSCLLLLTLHIHNTRYVHI